MSTNYTKKSPERLAFSANKRYIRKRVDDVLQTLREEILDTLFDEMSQDFQEGLNQGEIRRLGPSMDKIRSAIAESAYQLPESTS